MTGIYRTSFDFIHIVWIIPILIFLQFVSEHSIYEIFNRGKMSTRLTLVYNPFRSLDTYHFNA